MKNCGKFINTKTLMKVRKILYSYILLKRTTHYCCIDSRFINLAFYNFLSVLIPN